MKRTALFLVSASSADETRLRGASELSARLVRIATVAAALLALVLFVAPNQAQAQCNSTGSGNWNSAARWSCGHVPTTGDAVVIQTGHTITFDASATISSLTTNGTGTLSFNENGDRSLTVSGSVTNGGTIQAASASGTRVYALNVGGNFTNNGTFTATGGDEILNVVLNGSGITQTISGTTTFFNLTLNNSTATTNFGTSSTTIANNLTTSAGTMNGGSSTITFTGASASMSGANNKNFFNLIINSGASITNSGSNVTIKGDFTNNGTFTTGTNTVTFNGSAAQTIGGSSSTTFQSLTINNSASTVTLNTNTTVNQVLTLTSDLTTGAAITLTQPNTGTSSGTGDVVGNVKRTGTFGISTFSYGNPNTTITLTVPGVQPSDITVNMAKGSVPNDFTNAIQRVYTITPNGGSGFVATLRLHYLTSELNGNTESGLQLWKQTGGSGTWQLQGKTGQSTVSPNNWAELTGVTSFSPWTLSSALAPTEADILAFDAASDDSGTVFLQWRTGREVNNLGFNIYREESGKLTRINPSILAGSALLLNSNITLKAGHSYVWSDSLQNSKKLVQYWLEDVDLHGKTTLHGPISPTRGGKLPTQAQAVLLTKLAGNARANTTSQQQQVLPSSARGAGTAAKGIINPGPATSPLQTQWEVAAQPGVKLSINKTGWYRVGQPDLVSAGLNPARDPRFLQLFVDGIEQTFIVNGGQNGRLDPTDSIEFYGTRLDTASTDAHTYYLISGSQPGRRINTVPGNGQQGATQSFPFTIERRDRANYLAWLKNGEAENWFGPFVTSTPTTQSLTVEHWNQVAQDEIVLELALQGMTDVTDGPPDHSVNVLLNGSQLSAISFDGQARQLSRLSVPKSMLVEGDNVITLQAQGGEMDVSLIDYVRLTYPHTYNADNSRLACLATGGEAVKIGGFNTAAIKVLDITDPNALQQIDGTIAPEGNGFAVTVASPVAGQRMLLAYGEQQMLRPASITSNQPSTWNRKGLADLVIISHASFVGSIEPLKVLRKSQKYDVSVIDVEDLYDEFSYGAHSPQAIKDFLARAKATWKKAPRFVLLAGDASVDPRNYLGIGETDFVPTKLVETAQLETASDDWLADFNGDGLAEMAVGRLPGQTWAEMSIMVSKVIRYEQSEPIERVLLVADKNDGFDFEGSTSQLRGLIPANIAIQEIDRGRTDDVTARAQLLVAINRGQKIINYTGHGSTRVWDGEILTAADAASLENTERMGLFVTMTCLNGYFHYPVLESLGEAMIKSEGGAVAVWASSGLTNPDGQAVTNQELVRRLFNGTGLTIGEATIRAKAAVGDSDVRRTWILFGDPMTKLK